MTQSWRTLGAVAVGAMVAGWLVMRVLRPSPPVTVANHPPREDVVHRASPLPDTAQPRERSASTSAQTTGTEDPQAHREQDLIALETALFRDHRIRDLLFLYPGITSFPSIITYRRPKDFWEPAFADAIRSQR